MMPVLLAALGEAALVGRVRARVEHPGIFAVPGNAVSLEVLDVLGEWR
jgi:hypothetical protein